MACSSSSVFTSVLPVFQYVRCKLAGPLRHVHASRVLGLLRGLRPAPRLRDRRVASRRRGAGRRPRSSPSTREACTWRRGPASLQRTYWKTGRTLVNTDELEQAIYMAERRVLEIQAKLHRWAGEASSRRFDDLYNLVCDPAFLLA